MPERTASRASSSQADENPSLAPDPPSRGPSKKSAVAPAPPPQPLQIKAPLSPSADEEPLPPELLLRAAKVRRQRLWDATLLLSGSELPLPASLNWGLDRARYLMYETLTDPSSFVGFLAMIIMIATIAVSVVAFCAQTMPDIRVREALGIYGGIERTFNDLDLGVTIIFTIEYVLRLVSVTAVPTAAEAEEIRKLAEADTNSDIPQPGKARSLAFARRSLQYSLYLMGCWILDPLNIIDFVAIAPYYVQLLVPSGVQLTFVRVLRLTRVVRLMKALKGFSGAIVIVRTMTAAASALLFLLFMFALSVCLFGCAIFFCEGGVYDPVLGLFMRENYSASGMEATPFLSIPHSFWWAIVTMATVGYGDFVPTSPAGRSLGSITIVCGVLVLAMPTTVVCLSFANEYSIWTREEEERLDAERAEIELLAREMRKDDQAQAIALPMKQLKHVPSSGNLDSSSRKTSLHMRNNKRGSITFGGMTFNAAGLVDDSLVAGDVAALRAECSALKEMVTALQAQVAALPAALLAAQLRGSA